MREQFLKLLAEHPGDINIGLIYADWLAEQGDSEEAYWRDPRIYAQAYTAIFDGFGDRSGWMHGGMFLLYIDGTGTGCGDEYGCYGDDADGVGDGRYAAWVEFEDGTGSIFGEQFRCRISPGKEAGNNENYYGKFVRWEILMEGRYILVCDRGFVLVGDVSPHPSDWQRVIVDHCATVRQWGTTRGLGQLALEGPQPETILDYEGNGVDVLRATILRAIPCNESAWEHYPESITNPAE